MSLALNGTRAASWAERGATAMVFLTLGLMGGAWAAALPGLKLKLNLSAGMLSVALFSLSVGAVLASTLAGFVLPRFATGRSTGVAALIMVLPFSLIPLAASLPQLLAATFGVGLVTGLLDVAVNGHAGDVEVRWGNPIMSSFHGGFSLGGLIGAGLGGLIIWAGLGVEAQIWIPVAIGAFGNLCALPFLGEGQVAGAAPGAMMRPNRAMMGLCLVVVLVFVIEGAMADWSAVYLSSVAGSSLAVAAIGYAAFSIMMAAGRLGGDVAMARIGPRRLVTAGGCLAALGLGVAVAFAEPAPAILGFALVGIGAANVVPAVYSAAARASSSPAAGIALVTTVGYAGFLSGPPIIGSIAAWTNLRFAIGCLVAAAAVAAGAGFMVFGGGKKP